MPGPTFDDEIADLSRSLAELAGELNRLSSRIVALERRRAEPKGDVEVPFAAPRKPIEPIEQPAPKHSDAIDRPPLIPASIPQVPPAEIRETPGPETPSVRNRIVLEHWTDTIRDIGLPEPSESSRGSSRAAGATELAIGRTWLNRIGAVILLLGAAFFVQYSVAQGWIGPTLRVVLAAVFGIGLIVTGEVLLRRDMKPVAGGLVGCGIGILYVAAFATHNLYHLVGTETAFGLFCAVTVVAVALSVHSRNLSIAVLGLIGGFGTPVLISSGNNQQVELLSYLLVCWTLGSWSSHHYGAGTSSDRWRGWVR